MLNVIAQIGKIAAEKESDLLEFLVPEQSNYKVLAGLDFKTDKKSIEISLVKFTDADGFSKKVLRDFLLIPAAKGNRPQFAVTSTKLDYLISQVVPNLIKHLDDCPLKERLKKLLAIFWKRTKDKEDSSYGYVLDPSSFKEIQVDFDFNAKKVKESIAAYATNLKKAIAEQIQTNAKELLFTFLIDGKPLAREKEYQEFILHQSFESAFEKTKQQRCTTCGKVDEVSQDTTRFLFKFYMTDKINFASYFDKKNFDKAVTLCRDCYRDIVVGEKWIDANLRTKIGNFQVYILPQILYQTDNYQFVMDELQNIQYQFNSAKSIGELREKEKEVLSYFSSAPFIFNFLFFRQSQSAFKVLTLIKDVPPSRIHDMAVATSEVDEIARRHNFPDSANFDLNQIYWLIPIKKKGADHIEYRKLLQLFDNLFNGYQFSAQSLYNSFVQLAHIHKTETYSLYQISRSGNADWALKNDVLKWNLFLLFLKKLNLFDGGEFMETGQLKEFFPSGMAEIFADLGYNRAQQGLALLGFVLGAVANAQYKERLENKPILEKVSYQGMNEEKTIRLFNELFEKIKQYRRHIGYAERWWSAAKQLYESASKENANLTANERVFYLLSGYSFHLLGSGKKEESEKISENND